MRRFRFRLRRYLRLKERLEEIQRVETLRQEGRVEDLNRLGRVLLAEEAEVRGVLAPERGRRWSGQTQEEHYRYFLRLKQEEAMNHQALEVETRVLGEKRALLIERSRERRTVERLKERRAGAWREEAEKEERGELDDIGGLSARRAREKGAILFKLVLGTLMLAAAAFCALAWTNWLRDGEVGFPALRAPFDALAQRRVREQVLAFDFEQQVRRRKRDALVAEAVARAPALVVEEKEGYKRTLEIIRQKEENLRQKEEELRARELAVERGERDLRADMNIRSNLEKRIDEKWRDLSELEDKRTRELAAEKERKLHELAQTVSSQNPKAAAELLLQVAFPDLRDPDAPPFPPGEKIEGRELVVELMGRLKAKNRAEILDRMVKSDPAHSALLLDLLDNVRTGIEPD